MRIKAIAREEAWLTHDELRKCDHCGRRHGVLVWVGDESTTLCVGTGCAKKLVAKTPARDFVLSKAQGWSGYSEAARAYIAERQLANLGVEVGR